MKFRFLLTEETVCIKLLIAKGNTASTLYYTRDYMYVK